MLDVQVEVRLLDRTNGDDIEGVHIVEERELGTDSDIRRLARRAVAKAEAALKTQAASLEDESGPDA